MWSLRRRAASVAPELDALGKRQFAGKIDRVRLTAHVHLPRIASAFTATAGLFLAAKGPANLSAARPRVHVCNAAIAADRAEEFFGFAHVVGENRGSQPLRHAVVDRDRFVEVAVGQQIEERSKGLVTHNFKIRFRVRQARRHIAAAGILFALEPLAPVKHFAALIL